jgi:hypothetical protein
MDRPPSTGLNQSDRAYLTKVELARRTGLSPATIERYKNAGKIPFFQPGGKGGRVVYPVDAIEAAHRQQDSDRLPAGKDGPTVGPPVRIPGPQPRWLNQST